MVTSAFEEGVAKKWDVVLATQIENLNPIDKTEYAENILQEESLLLEALQKLNLKACCIGWNDPQFAWSSTNCVIIRETWDYFHRIDEYKAWLSSVKDQTTLINPFDTLSWNLDKFYLKDLELKGVVIPPTIFVKRGERKTLTHWIDESGWDELVIKPAVAGGARDTHRIRKMEISKYEQIFQSLVRNERMLIQEFQTNILTEGEKTLVMIGGEFTHGILKKGKPGDFRVQDDHGGTVHNYQPSQKEINFAIHAIGKVSPTPAYGRVDILTDNAGNLVLQELELIEPELWFRFNPKAANLLGAKVKDYLETVS